MNDSKSKICIHLEDSAKILNLENFVEENSFFTDNTFFEYSPNGNYIYTYTNDALNDVKTGKSVKILDYNIWSGKFNSNSTMFAGVDWLKPTIKVLNTSNGEILHEFLHYPTVFSVKFSPDNSKLLSHADGNSIIIWDLKKGEKIHEFELEDKYYEYDMYFNTKGDKALFIFLFNKNHWDANPLYVYEIWDLNKACKIHTSYEMNSDSYGNIPDYKIKTLPNDNWLVEYVGTSTIQERARDNKTYKSFLITAPPLQHVIDQYKSKLKGRTLDQEEKKQLYIYD